jgi:hypothetical protein
MSPTQHRAAKAGLITVLLFGLLAFSLQRGGDWLVRSDSAYYWLGDHGFRFVTNCAEVLFLFGPVVSFGGGVFLGMVLLVGWHLSRSLRHSTQ